MAQRIERKNRRVRARSVTARLRAGDTEIAGEVENLSRSGLYVRTDELLFVGAKVQVELARPDGKRVLSLPGCVADMIEADRAASLGRKIGMGISFDPIGDAEAAGQLDGLLRDLANVTQEALPPVRDDGELQRLRAQLRSLLIDVSDLKRSLAERDALIEQLRRELAELKR